MSTGRTAILVLIAGTAWAQEAAVAPPSPAPIPAPIPLTAVKRVCVDRFVGDADFGAQARDLAIASLYAAKSFSITEKCEKAAILLKGAVSRTRGYRSRSEGDGTRFGEGARVSDTFGRIAASVTGASDERLASSESQEYASVALRLVDEDGEVLWAYSVDSSGGKTKAAVSDAVDQAIKQLLRDIERAKRPMTEGAKK